MSPQRDLGWYWRYAFAVRAATVEVFDDRRCCVEGVRVGVEVGRYFGLRLQPVPVSASAATRDWIDSRGTTGWSVGVSGTGRLDHTRNGWDGHLVGVGDGMFFDFAAEQFSRPEKGLTVAGPVVIPASLPNVREGLAVADGDNVVYQAKAVGDQSWRQFPAWRDRAALVRSCVAAAIVAIREADTPAQSRRNGG